MDVVCGGYFLVKPSPRHEYMNAELVPSRVLSVSECLCNCVSTNWAVDWVDHSKEEQIAAAEQLGIQRDVVRRALAWTNKAFETGELGYPNVFLSLELARKFRDEFVATPTDLKLLGIGLPSDLVDEFLQESAPTASEGEAGTYTAMSLRKPLESGGQVLGFEILGLEYTSFHSALCNSLENEFAEKLGCKANSHGFIANEAEARRCAVYAGLETTGAEPGLWQPWQIVLYP